MSEIEHIRPETPRAGTTADATLDRRVRRTRRGILDATVELMKTRGVDGLTMDAIAEAADVSRSTLYRHWPQLHDLLFDGLQHLGDQIGAVTTAPVEGDTFDQCVAAKALIVGQALRDDAWRSLVSTVGMAAAHNADAAAVYDRWLTFCRDGVTEFVRGCQAAGHADASLDPEWISDLVLGPIYMHAFVLNQPMSDEQINDHVARTQAMISTGPPEEP
jgi:AcrR family transcriptional regulator